MLGARFHQKTNARCMKGWFFMGALEGSVTEFLMYQASNPGFGL